MLDIMNMSDSREDLIRQEHWMTEQLPWIQQNSKWAGVVIRRRWTFKRTKLPTHKTRAGTGMNLQ